MPRQIASYLFYPAGNRSPVRDQFAEVHRTRLRFLLPLLTAVALFLLATDLVKTGEPGADRLYLWAVYCNAGFLALHLVTWAVFLMTKRLDREIFFIHVFLTMEWAALLAAIELYHTGNVTTIVITVMGVSVLALYPFFVFSALVASCIGTFLLALFLFPGSEVPPVDRLLFLFSLALVSIGVSRALFSASVENILSTARLSKANRELQAMQLKLIQKEKFAAIGQLSAGIAHEINNPLGFIKSNFSTLEQGFHYIRAAVPRRDGDEAYGHFLDGLDRLFQDTREGFRRISDVIENLRSFSHELPEGSFALYDLVEGVESTLVIARNRYKNVARIERHFAPVPQIPARGSEINQVLLNLLLNAVIAVASTGPGREGVITVSTKTDGSMVFFEISDTGPGVPEALRTRIFDPFFTTNPVGEGFGLGLSLSWEIVVNRHQGSLDLLDGKPTTFRVSLPIRRPASTVGSPSVPGADQAPRR